MRMSPILIGKALGKLVMTSTAERCGRTYHLRMISFCSDTAHGFLHTTHQLFVDTIFPQF